MNNQKYKFILPPLPFAYDSLNPYISEETLKFHYDKHFQTYVDNLNKALENYPEFQRWSLEKLVCDYSKLPENIKNTVRNNAGGVYNHYLYFDLMTPNSTKKPVGIIGNAIDKRFGSYDMFKKEIKNVALNTFGSGWAWLVKDKDGNLKIISTQNQDTPFTLNLYPILLVDVWEHAYYLQYQNRRADYLDNWFNVIDWEKIEKNFNML